MQSAEGRALLLKKDLQGLNDWMENIELTIEKMKVTCPICFESCPGDGMCIQIHPCYHVFHMECIKKVKDKKCPVCRGEFRYPHESVQSNESSEAVFPPDLPAVLPPIPANPMPPPLRRQSRI